MIALITIAAGRHDHLAGQLAGVARGDRRPELQVIVAMGDPEIRQVVDAAEAENPGAPDGSPAGDQPAIEVIEVDPKDLARRRGRPELAAELPLAHARNAGADRAIAAGASTLIFLDVDCIPGTELVQDYAAAISRSAAGPPTVWCGQVRYLPPVNGPYRFEQLPELGRAHPARPEPAAGSIEYSDDPKMFWSLSFAVTAEHWQQVGGFCEEYFGYGGEDTDFGRQLIARAGRLGWLGGAPAYHQHHASVSPPWPHLAAIVRNANLFHRRWGEFPMEGWLAAFAEAGAITLADGQWELTGTPQDEPVDRSRSAR